MHHTLFRKWVAVLMVSLAPLVVSCAGGKDFTYTSDNEVPQGPGLFSGKDGVFTIYRKTSDKTTDPTSTETASPPESTE